MSDFVETDYERLDPWAGWAPILIQRFRTKRNGHNVIRYNLRCLSWSYHWGNARDMESPEAALRVARNLTILQPHQFRVRRI